MSTLDNQRVQYELALKTLLEALATEIGESGGGAGGSGTGTILPARLTIINYVKAKLNELIPEGEGITFSLSSAPNISNPLDLLINAHLDEATKDVILSAPLSVLFPESVSGSGTPFSTGSKTGYIQLPSDFLRFMALKMSDWKTEVTTLTHPQSAQYRRQAYSFLRGDLSNPIAVINWKLIGSPTPTSKRILEYYSVESSHTIEKLLYIPEQYAEDFLTVNPNLIDSLAWMCAGKIMQITGMVNEAKMAQERVSQSYLNL